MLTSIVILSSLLALSVYFNVRGRIKVSKLESTVFWLRIKTNRG